VEDVFHYVLAAIEAVYPIVLLVLSVRTFVLWGVDRLRVTDWLGYIVFGVFLAAGLIGAWESLGTWGVASAVIGVGVGLAWVRRDRRILRGRDQDDGQEIVGFFLVSRHRVPDGVRNWFG
jgi:hypothetical protein